MVDFSGPGFRVGVFGVMLLLDCVGCVCGCISGWVVTGVFGLLWWFSGSGGLVV